MFAAGIVVAQLRGGRSTWMMLRLMRGLDVAGGDGR